MTNSSHVQADGTIFPPVTPDPPNPPGYEEPVLLDSDVLLQSADEGDDVEEPPD